jgi:hypothetical protein
MLKVGTTRIEEEEGLLIKLHKYLRRLYITLKTASFYKPSLVALNLRLNAQKLALTA